MRLAGNIVPQIVITANNGWQLRLFVRKMQSVLLAISTFLFFRSQILMILFMAVNVVISPAGTIPGSGQGKKRKAKLKKRKIDVCLILLNGSAFSVLLCFFTSGPTTKLDDSFSVALLEALAG